MTTSKTPHRFAENPATIYLSNWLAEDWGRAEFFAKIDSALFPSMISKMKRGVVPITFEYAIRMERAQKPSGNPLKAELLMTFVEHRALYRYVTGQDPAPSKNVPQSLRTLRHMTQAE